MAAAERNDELNESWVDLSNQPFHTAGTIQNAILEKGDLVERLLIDALRESKESSRQTSNKSSQRASPKSPNSPNTELATTSLTIQPVQDMIQDDWIWDWASRPEALPPSDLGKRMKHPNRPRLSVRNTPLMKSGIFLWENLPALLVSHACTFFLGAAVMFICMKKYWVMVVPPTE